MPCNKPNEAAKVQIIAHIHTTLLRTFTPLSRQKESATP